MYPWTLLRNHGVLRPELIGELRACGVWTDSRLKALCPIGLFPSPAKISKLLEAIPSERHGVVLQGVGRYVLRMRHLALPFPSPDWEHTCMNGLADRAVPKQDISSISLRVV
jgi:hypothetical protein